MEIVYQDRRIVVAVKPSGVLSTDEPGGAPELLRAQLGTECIRTVHRLDAQVAGLMVFARSARAASILSDRCVSAGSGRNTSPSSTVSRRRSAACCATCSGATARGG